MKISQLAVAIITKLGGENNVSDLTHCATRLRFKLNDYNKVDKDELNALGDVLSVVESGGQLQVVIGNKVSSVYKEINLQYKGIGNLSEETLGGTAQKQSIIAVIFDYISGTFSPLLPALAGSGMIKALLALLENLNLIDSKASTYSVLNAASNGLFYFLPIFIAITAAKKLNANPFVGGIIGAALLEPNFTQLVDKTGTDFIGIPLLAADYASSVFPLLLAIAIYAPLERSLKKIIPEVVQIMFVPMIALFLMVPLVALVFGPFGEYLSKVIGVGIDSLLSVSAILTGIILAGAYPFLVILGVHWGLIPIMIDNFSNGGDSIIAITSGATFSQMGIAFGIFLLARNDKQLSSISFAGSLSGLLAGVTEPILYGIILRYKKTIPILIISSTISGAVIAVFSVKVYSFLLNNLFSIPGYTPTFGYVIGIAVAFIASALLTYVFNPIKQDRDSARNKRVGLVSSAGKPQVDNIDDIGGTTLKNKQLQIIQSPINGKQIMLSEVNDPVFSTEAMGRGLAIVPEEGKVYAPFDGTIKILFPSLHAIGLESDTGVELLIHVGLETVNLQGEGYKVHVTTDQHVHKGELLIDFDMTMIQAKGYDLVTPMIVTNSNQYDDFVVLENKNVQTGDDLIEINNS